MAKLNVINIPSPGSLGLNTEDVGVDLPIQFAKILTNGVLTQEGRAAARKGIEEWTPSAAFTGVVKSMYETRNIDGSSEIVFGAGNKIYQNYPTMIDITGAASVTDSDWKFQVNEDVLFATQANHASLAWKKTLTTWTPQVITQPAEMTTQKPAICLSGWGRMFAAVGTTNKTTVWFSEDLNALSFSNPGSGFFDISDVVLSSDQIVALASLGNRLVILCTNQLLVYTVDPEATPFLALEEVITGIGCIARNSVVNTGKDLIWLSTQGLVSFQRLSDGSGSNQLPIGDVSRHVHTGIQIEIENTVDFNAVKAVWWSSEQAYLIFFPQTKSIFYFSFRNVQSPLPTCSKWESLKTTASFLFSNVTRTLLFGGDSTLYRYQGYGTVQDTYQFKYYSGYLDFQSPESLKFLKVLSFLVKSSITQNTAIKWAFDYNQSYESRTLTTFSGSASVSQYNIDEYGIAEYSAGALINDLRVIGALSGQSLQIGLETEINGNEFVILRCEVQATTGKVY